MPGELRVRTATDADADAVLALLEEATGWLARRGSDQWQRTDARLLGVRRDIGEGTLFLVVDRDRVVGTITVDGLADTEFWTERDQVRSALYLHRMAVARDRAGESIGSAMLDWAGRRALLSRRTRLRLDAWRTNQDLHKYYVKQAFRLVRVVEPPAERPRGSGALFERLAGIQRLDGPLLVPDRQHGDRSPRDPGPAPLPSPQWPRRPPSSGSGVT